MRSGDSSWHGVDVAYSTVTWESLCWFQWSQPLDPVRWNSAGWECLHSDPCAKMMKKFPVSPQQYSDDYTTLQLPDVKYSENAKYLLDVPRGSWQLVWNGEQHPFVAHRSYRRIIQNNHIHARCLLKARSRLATPHATLDQYAMREEYTSKCNSLPTSKPP